jgi:LuxR family transcriptional regulator, maltose regulon positive regulatory protein
MQGNLKEARRILEDALEITHQQKVQSYGCVSRLQTALANIYYEQGQLKTALSLVEDAIAGNRFWKNPNHLIYAYATRAHIQISSGEFLGAKDTLEQADHEMRSLPVLGTVAALLDAAKVRLWLNSGERSLAAGWAARNKASFSEKASRKLRRSYKEDVELNQITAIRVMLSEDRVDDAAALLEQLLPDASAGGRKRAVLKLTILRALAEAQAGSKSQALDWLDQAVQQAAEQDYVQVFIDEGPVVERLLRKIAESDRLGSTYANHLLSAIAAPKPAIQFTPVTKPTLDKKHAITRSLSQREMEVLNLIAQGLTNHQIAVRLIISTGTVKAHSANIYRKLAAGNRFQAVERARDLKLLV